MTDEYDKPGDDITEEENTVTLRNLIRNAEKLSDGPATPLHEAIEAQFQRFQRATKPVADSLGSREGYDTGQEDPEFEPLERGSFRPGERAAIVGKHLFGIRGVTIGGRLVDDLVLVNSKRAEFTVPIDADPDDEVAVIYEAFDPAKRRPEMNLTGPPVLRPPSAE
jgi:hypothetical protein